MRRLLGVASLLIASLMCMSAGHAGAPSAGVPAGSLHPGSCANGRGAGGIHCLGVWRRTSGAGPQNSGLTATQLRGIYHVPAATTAGTGPVVAVIDPYHYDGAASDLNTYRAAYGLPACTNTGPTPCFREVDEHGGSTYSSETANDDWSAETALDLQMVSSSCPSCRLLLVSASNELALPAAISQAVAQGAKYVSMSFGGRSHHFSSTFFQRWPDVIFTAASGDDGYEGADWPNEATHVLAIGGVRVAHGRLSVWNDRYGATNSGCARPDKSGKTPPMPTQQRADSAAWKTCGNGHKAETDLSAIADPGTGVANYVAGRWYQAGGTSAAAPIIAGLYADAGNHTDPYAAYANGGIADVTHGSICVRHVSGRICQASKGWDGPTGLGMPTSPAAVAAAPAAPALTNVPALHARTKHSFKKTIALPRTTHAADGSTVTLSSAQAIVRGLPEGLTAHVHGRRLVIKGKADRVGHGRAALYVWGRTSSGRRSEAAGTTFTWRVAAHPGR